MAQTLDQTVMAEIKRFAAFTPQELKTLAATTHADIKRINEALWRDSVLSPEELARGRMLYNDFVTALASGATHPAQGLMRNKDFRLCMIAGTMIESDDMLALSKAYQAQDWQGFCIESIELAKTIGDLLTVLDVSARQRPGDKQLRAEIDDCILNAEKDNKFFQLHMILEAPAQAINYVWSRERKEDVQMYAAMMKQLADARGDADVSKVVDALIAQAGPAKVAKPVRAKTPRQPKK